MTRFLSTLAIVLAIGGALSGAAYAGPQQPAGCTIDSGYNRVSACDVNGA